jgi:hypothetical protein
MANTVFSPLLSSDGDEWRCRNADNESLPPSNFFFPYSLSIKTIKNRPPSQTSVHAHLISKFFTMTTVSSNTAATATATAKAKTAAAKAMRQKNNENAAKFLTLGMAGIIVVFVVFHWTRMFYKHCGTRQSRSSSVLEFPIAFTRSGF